MGRHGSLAQLVEQLTFNQLVAGSNPARPTIFSSEDVKHRRAISSVGRAPPLQGGGHWFEPGIAHHSFSLKDTHDGAIAQLGERFAGSEEVSSSILLSSTTL